MNESVDETIFFKVETFTCEGALGTAPQKPRVLLKVLKSGRVYMHCAQIIEIKLREARFPNIRQDLTICHANPYIPGTDLQEIIIKAEQLAKEDHPRNPSDRIALRQRMILNAFPICPFF